MVGNISAATSGSLRVAASLSVTAVVFPVSTRHQEAACSLPHIIISPPFPNMRQCQVEGQNFLGQNFVNTLAVESPL